MSKKETQVEIAERLQKKWLERMEAMLDDGTITSTDRATLYRFFAQNGWTVDPKKMPKGLRDKLTTDVTEEELEDDGILPMRRKA